MVWIRSSGRNGARKLVHHRCGYPLWAEVLGRFDEVREWETVSSPGDCFVVSYRCAEQGVQPIIVSMCPCCRRSLQLWWPVENEGNEGV